MISADKDALICDLAVTYGIYDYRALPVPTLATLAVGLREDSRIKMRLIGAKLPRKDLLLAAAVDRLSIMAWLMSEDGRQGKNRPESILGIILGTKQPASQVQVFDSAEEFEKRWAKITEVSYGR